MITPTVCPIEAQGISVISGIFQKELQLVFEVSKVHKHPVCVDLHSSNFGYVFNDFVSRTVFGNANICFIDFCRNENFIIVV